MTWEELRQLVSSSFQEGSVKRIYDFLATQGFEVVAIGGMCPFQIEAMHPRGHSIYVRSRGDIFSLELYDCHYEDDLPEDDCLLWGGSFSCWDEPWAGYIVKDPDYCLYVLASLWRDAKDWVDS